MSDTTCRNSAVRLSALAEHIGASIAFLPCENLHEHRSANSDVYPDPIVSGVHHDSRAVVAGDIFVARSGEHVNGWDFVQTAINQGAVAILAQTIPCDRRIANGQLNLENMAHSLPVLLVDNVRRAMGQAAALIYGDPTRDLAVVGITGTNGKTTTSYLVRAALDGAGARTGVLGTLGATFETLHFPGVHTTPEADEVARVARAMLDHGASHLVMEVSSHALSQYRADAVHFRVAAFSNLTQDHLDYHKTLQAYAAAKDRLFYELQPGAAVIMVDDPHGKELATCLQQRKSSAMPSLCLCVSTEDHANADIFPIGPVHFDARGLRCTVRTPDGNVELAAPFVGKHNLANLLLTLGIVSALGFSPTRAAQSLANAPSVPGRLERCDGPTDDIGVLVDYAHTPDALERALLAIRQVTGGNITCVFGCGGDRDRAKREVMGRVAAAGADIAIVTNDNPRTENPQTIADSIVFGMKGGKATYRVQLNRAVAIEEAIGSACPGDVVLIAGKGHEPYQLIGNEVHAFDDRDHARQALQRRRQRKQFDVVGATSSPRAGKE